MSNEHVYLSLGHHGRKAFLGGVKQPRIPPPTRLVMASSTVFSTGAGGLVFKGRPEDVFIKTLLAFGILAASFFGQTVKYGVVAQK